LPKLQNVQICSSVEEAANEVDSRASVTIALNALTDLDVVERTVSSQRPVRTTYRLNKKGRAVLQHLKEMSKEF
jgi:DNA-binding HxlR family transcriptional regulator